MTKGSPGRCSVIFLTLHRPTYLPLPPSLPNTRIPPSRTSPQCHRHHAVDRPAQPRHSDPQQPTQQTPQPMTIPHTTRTNTRSSDVTPWRIASAASSAAHPGRIRHPTVQLLPPRPLLPLLPPWPCLLLYLADPSRPTPLPPPRLVTRHPYHRPVPNRSSPGPTPTLIGDPSPTRRRATQEPPRLRTAYASCFARDAPRPPPLPLTPYLPSSRDQPTYHRHLSPPRNPNPAPPTLEPLGISWRTSYTPMSTMRTRRLRRPSFLPDRRPRTSG